jgi:hypothetical protein
VWLYGFKLFLKKQTKCENNEICNDAMKSGSGKKLRRFRIFCHVQC